MFTPPTKECANLHGHTYQVKVKISSERENFSDVSSSMLIDFKQIKDIIRILDHTVILPSQYENLGTEIKKVTGQPIVYLPNPTAEAISFAILDEIKNRIGDLPIQVELVEGYKGNNSNKVICRSK